MENNFNGVKGLANQGIINGRNAKAKVVAQSTYWNKYDKVTYHDSVESAIAAAERGQEIDSKAHFRMYYYNVYQKLGNRWVEVEW